MKAFTKPAITRLEKALALITEEANELTRKLNEQSKKTPTGAVNKDLHRWEMERLTFFEDKLDRARIALKDVINGGKE